MPHDPPTNESTPASCLLPPFRGSEWPGAFYLSMTAPSPSAVLLLDQTAIERALKRIAHEILERNPDPTQLAIIGIPSRGVVIARQLAKFISQIEGRPVEHGVVDISMHRDDLARRPLPAVQATELPFDLDARTIILADDVAFTGRTCRAAMDALADFGRPARIQYAVLIDRGHRELPIRADYVGKNVPTALGERVYVRFADTDGVAADAVWLDQTPL
jgi:pyrimidine operon attenuation protein/uracil phosphoribosyltransferase